ncbi:MAG: hypothetical protein JXR48_11190, partial [Candidatus Delongbacteria bacterium]|nr:hypothetical protein [Candidatus Delongbacteria bacterium]
NHNPAFGYNTLEGYLEENCVRAMDQIINERFNISEDAKTRWKENDDGMHVFAAALYYVMKQKQFYDSGVGITEFLYNEVTGGELTKGNIVKVYNEFYGD